MIVKLTKGKIALIDQEDFEKVNQFKWFFEGRYAETHINGKMVYLHRFILNAPQGKLVDHKDGNKLNCQKSNLRFATKSQNAMNRKSLGVIFDKKRKKWLAQIKINYKNKFLGYYQNLWTAKLARRWAEKIYFKEFKYAN